MYTKIEGLSYRIIIYMKYIFIVIYMYYIYVCMYVYQVLINFSIYQNSKRKFYDKIVH